MSPRQSQHDPAGNKIASPMVSAIRPICFHADSVYQDLLTIKRNAMRVKRETGVKVMDSQPRKENRIFINCGQGLLFKMEK